MAVAQDRGKSSDRRLCVATTARGTICGNRASFIYQVIEGKQEPLCGIHAKLVWGSRGLREIRS